MTVQFNRAQVQPTDKSIRNRSFINMIEFSFGLEQELIRLPCLFCFQPK